MKKIGSDETKAFLTGILLYRVYRYFENLGQKEVSSDLRSILVIEEAHRLFRKTTEKGGSITGNNTKHHSVEMFENIMAEVRSYGLGLIIADQLPLRLSDGAVKNTNIKIIHRLAAREDAVDMGGGMGLDEKQSAFINILPRGEALAISPNLLEAAHVKVLAKENITTDILVKDSEIRAKWASNISVVRPPHFDSFVEKIKEKDTNCLNAAGSKFFTLMQLCSVKNLQEFWNAAVWSLFEDIKALGISVNGIDGNLLATHLLHYAVAGALRGRQYLQQQQRKELIVYWEHSLSFNSEKNIYSLNPDQVLKLKRAIETFVKNNVISLPQWIAPIISESRIQPVYREAEVFANDLYKDRQKDIATALKHDLTSAAAMIAHKIRQLSNEKITGERPVDFGFTVMLHLLNSIHPNGYEKPSTQTLIYETLTKIIGEKK
jgi:hypothetical protein